MADALANKVAIITGAAQGIGKALALGLADRGATVIASDLNLAGAEAIAAQIAAARGRAYPLRLDVADSAEIRDAMSFAADVGGIDILINNAGVFPRSAVLEMDEREWDHVIAVNLTGTFLCSKAASGLMRKQGRGGRIVNVTSGAAFMVTANAAHYSASKAGIVALTRTLALELAPHRVTVNAIAPGLTDTAQPRIAYSEEDLQAFASRIPLGRIAQPEDMVPAVLFLCSDGAGYITGQTLHVNGGLYMP